MECGYKICKLRKAMGWTQRDLAQRLGVSPAAVALWELGINVPKLRNLRAMADLFSCSLDYLAS